MQLIVSHPHLLAWEVKNQLHKFVGGETVNRLATYTRFFKKSKSFSLSLFECTNLRSERNISLKVHTKKWKYNLYISFATNNFRFTVKEIFWKDQYSIKGVLRNFHHLKNTQQHLKFFLTFNKSVTYREHLLPSVFRIQVLWKKREEGYRWRQKKKKKDRLHWCAHIITMYTPTPEEAALLIEVFSHQFSNSLVSG